MAMYDHFIVWLDGTQLSLLFKVTSWLVPLMQSIHILAIGVVVSGGVIILLRVTGVNACHVDIAALNERLIPPIWWALLVLLLTGLILIITEPGRAMVNPFFFAKMLCVVAFVVLTRWFQLAVRRQPQRWSGSASLPPARLPICVLALLLLLAIVFCGRWIAYYNV